MRRPRVRSPRRRLLGGDSAGRDALSFAGFAAEYTRSRAHDIPASISRVHDTVAAALPVFGDIPVSDIEARHIDQFRAHRLESVAPGTVKRELAVLNAIFRTAIRHQLRTDNPCAGVRVAKYQEAARRSLSFDEERRLVATAAPHLRAFIAIAVNTGLRLSELTGLDWSDVDLHSNRIVLRATKSRKVQTVPINRLARDALLGLRRDGGDGPVFLFRGRRLANPKKGIAHAAKRAGLGKVTSHVFRHTCATRLLAAGVDIRNVQAWLRHASLTTTARYLHSMDLSEAARKLADFNEEGHRPGPGDVEGS